MSVGPLKLSRQWTPEPEEGRGQQGDPDPSTLWSGAPQGAKAISASDHCPQEKVRKAMRTSKPSA